MNEKVKKRLAIGGCAVIGIALITAIGGQFSKTPVQADILPIESTLNTEMTVAPPETASPVPSIEEKEVMTQPETSAALLETNQTEQSIQQKVEKPTLPNKEVATNPAQKPDGTKVEEPPIPVEHEKVTAPTEAEAPTQAVTEAVTEGPKEEDAAPDGKSYFPGFGYLDGTGDAIGSTAEDMYENGNKIGDMGN